MEIVWTPSMQPTNNLLKELIGTKFIKNIIIASLLLWISANIIQIYEFIKK